MEISRGGGIGSRAVPSPRRSTAVREAGFGALLTPDAAAAGEASAAEAPAPAPALSTAGEEACPDAGARDAHARQHGGAMLTALRALQLAGLGVPAPLVREALAALARERPQAADPALEDALRAIAVRVAVEMARQR